MGLNLVMIFVSEGCSSLKVTSYFQLLFKTMIMKVVSLVQRLQMLIVFVLDNNL